MYREKLKNLIDRVGDFIENSKFSGIVVALVSLIIVILFSFTNIYEKFKLNLYDMSLLMKPSIDIKSNLTFLDIDENSVTTVGNFPWPRHIYVKGLNVLNEVGVDYAVLDIMFPDKSPMQINREFLKSMEKKKGSTSFDIKELNKIVIDNDKLFSQGIAEMGRVILSYTFNPDSLTEDVLKKQKTAKN